MESESVVSVESPIPLFPTVPGAAPVMSEGHSTWMERAPHKRLMLFTGRSNPELGAKISKHLGIELGQALLKTFTNGEVYVRYEESIRGADMFIVQSCSSPTNDSLMELLIMINAARLASAKRITAVMPWFPYSRQDKKSAPREPITSKLVADMLEAAGADRVLTMDLHAGQLQGFFKIPVDHMTAVPLLADHFRLLVGEIPPENIVVVSGDAGRAKLAKKFSEMLGAGLALITKERPEQQMAEVTNVIGRVRDKVCIVIDDMIDTAGTLCAGGQALVDLGATEVYACATHAVFSGPALDNLADSVFRQVVVTDTIPGNPIERPDNVQVLSVAPILADTISNVFNDDSVSGLFHGGNQLF
ncbi:MAG: ribose-phosphate pyrophosphokinae [Gaiellales bacterium]|jgi:ribose-phosphate pyrophosphokinase|nr:ribose-phosphate pyrophosphokinae [Gaiellales bacterium]